MPDVGATLIAINTALNILKRISKGTRSIKLNQQAITLQSIILTVRADYLSL